MTEARTVFDAWMTTQGERKLTLTNDRRAKIKARLNEGFSVEELCDAVRGWVYDDWTERRRHCDVTTLLKNGSRAEYWRDLFRQHNKPKVGALTDDDRRKWFLQMARSTMQTLNIERPELLEELEQCEDHYDIARRFTRATGLTITGEPRL